ncbi:hypothetical protein DFH09DRAFT_1306055 [Mycena vulgaris]|nr:hypothetical protein DFH09DRAFT_1306055 [Mycena vulgaris]
MSYLDLVNICGNTRINSGLSPISSAFDAEDLLPLYLAPAKDSPIVGLLHPRIVDFLFAEQSGLPDSWAGLGTRHISFGTSHDTHAKRTEVMRALARRGALNPTLEQL